MPTATFRVLYCLFVIEHQRRRILHFNVTRHPSADWVVQQLRETFAEAAPYRYAILDHDSIFNDEVIAFLKAAGFKPKRTSIQCEVAIDTSRWLRCRFATSSPISGLTLAPCRLRQVAGDPLGKAFAATLT